MRLATRCPKARPSFLVRPLEFPLASVAAGYLPILLFLIVALGLSTGFVVLPMIVARVTPELAGVGSGNGLVRFLLPLASGGEAIVIAGRGFALDAELAARIERIAGEGNVDLSAQEPPRLALVG